MTDYNKSLVKAENGFFKKIFNYIKNIFFKKKLPKLENVANIENKEKISPIIENTKDSKNLSEKEKFFELYSQIKSKKIKVNNLQIDDLIKFNSIIKEEIELKRKKIIKQREQIEMLKIQTLN